MKRYMLLQKDRWDAVSNTNDSLRLELTEAIKFLESIKSGNLQATYEGDQQSEFGLALTSLRDRMVELNQEEEQRNWINRGLATFSDILRQQQDDIHQLFDQVVSKLVNYLGVNQGAIFVLNDDDPDDAHLQLISAYAYEKKKHVEMRVSIGEGLIGQCFLEKDLVYLSDVPRGYIRITSGLGEATPRCVVIVPLLLDREIVGVLELASFRAVEPYKIEFLKKIAENIAALYSSARNARRTRTLLQDSQAAGEQLKSQEEEMRQNMEELVATQEEVSRQMQRARDNQLYYNEIIEGIDDCIVTVDPGFQIMVANKAFRTLFSRYGVPVDPGNSLLAMAPGREEQFKQPYLRALAGEHVEEPLRHHFDRDFHVTYNPLRNTVGTIIGVSLIARDITDQRAQLKKTEAMLLESQQQAEELKAQEEEMRQNMEELNAQQDEMVRAMNEMDAREQYFNELINHSGDAIFTLNRKYRIETYNTRFAERMQQMDVKVKKGFDFFSILKPEAHAAHKERYDRAFAGEEFEHAETSMVNGHALPIVSRYSPMRDLKGEIATIACFTREVK
ncbi:PAS domain-containing protein [Parachryseolinea silvisoli]|uniref:PAS domain-containing protein n=1 Tax=Parachryseolinea silvisoli TaxID=2873601 RepID=UPI002265D908|nr:PAS domain-containing protein [Parachryseolinea silvisoli]